MEVPAFLRCAALRTRELQLVSSIKDNLVIWSELTLDLDPATVIYTEVGFYADGFIGIKRIAFKEDMSDAIFNNC